MIVPFPKPFVLDPELEKVLIKADELVDLASFMGLDDDTFRVYKDELDAGRLRYYLPRELNISAEEHLSALLSGDELPQTESDRIALNLYSLFDRSTSPEEEDTFSINTLIELHGTLLRGLPSSWGAGQYRAAGKDIGTLNRPEQVFPYLQKAVQLLTDEEHHPLIRVWLLYYLLHVTIPFEQENEMVIRQFCYAFLEHEGYGFCHLLRLEKYVFHDKRLIGYMTQVMEGRNFLENLEADLSHYLAICLDAFYTNLLNIEHLYHTAIKQSLGYDDLLPRHRNLINFFLMRSFYHFREAMYSFSAFQAEMIVAMLEVGEADSDEIAEAYQLSRDDVQVDMLRLVELGIFKFEHGKFSFDFDLRHSPLREQMESL